MAKRGQGRACILGDGRLGLDTWAAVRVWVVTGSLLLSGITSHSAALSTCCLSLYPVLLSYPTYFALPYLFYSFYLDRLFLPT